VELTPERVQEIKSQMPSLPRELREKFVNKYGIPAYDAELLTDTRDMARYFEELCGLTTHYKTASNWLMGPVRSYLNENGTEIAAFPLSPGTLAELIELVETQVISHSVATQKAFPALLDAPSRSPRELAEENDWLQNCNTDELETLVGEVLQAMPDKVMAYKKGKKGLMGLFVGEVMKKSKGKGDPKMINQLLETKLG